MHVAYRRGSVLLWLEDKIPSGRAISGVFFPIDSALYSIVFGTHMDTAEPIHMPLWVKTRVGPQNMYYIGCRSPKGKGQFLGVVRAFKSIGNFHCTSCYSIVARGIIHSPVTSCSRMDHSVCQAKANSILKIHCISKKDTALVCCNFDLHQPFLIILAGMLPRK